MKKRTPRPAWDASGAITPDFSKQIAVVRIEPDMPKE
jgi:hypothetical protein